MLMPLARNTRPASTDVTGVMDAFRNLGIRRLVMAAPFEDWVIDLIKKYYAASGFDIRSAESFGERESK